MQRELRFLGKGINRNDFLIPLTSDRTRIDLFIGTTVVLVGCTIGVFCMDTSHLENVSITQRSGKLASFVNAFVLGAFCLLPVSEVAETGFGVKTAPFLLQAMTALLYLWIIFFPEHTTLQCRTWSEEYCFFPLRAVFWLVSTMVMIYIKQSSRSSDMGALPPVRFYLTLVANWIMHVTGIVYQRDEGDLRYYALGASTMSFLFILYSFWDMLTPEVGGWGSELLRAMRTLDMITWTMFPIVVFAYDYGVFDYDKFHCICAILDIIAKGLYLQLLKSYRNAQLQGERDQMILRPQKDYFLQTIHELRNPLNACIACSEERGADNPEEMWKVVQDACEHMKQLVTDLLDNASQQVTLVERSFQLSEILILSQRLTKYRQQSCGVNVEISMTDDAVFQGDPLRISQVITNLLDNAIKFSKRGGKSVIVSTWYDALTIYFSVQDFGFGMSKKQVDGLFTTMFTQYHSGRVHGGSGVGLVLCGNLAKAMNGKITVESTEGSGTCFTLSLPARLPTTPFTTNPQLLQSPTPKTVVRRLSHVVKSIVCLVVDDSAINCRLLCRQLEAVGVLGPRSAPSGKEALRIISGDPTINVVLLDQHLGDMSGNDVCSVLRAMVRDVPLHIVSFSGSELECPDGLYNYVLRKPVSRATILLWLVHYQQVHVHSVASQLPSWA